MKKSTLAVLASIAAAMIAAVPSPDSRNEFTANGSTHVFTFTIAITTSSAHVEVLLNGVKQTSGYTVAPLLGQPNLTLGGTVTFTTELGAPNPPVAGTVVRIQRTVPLTQETVYTPYSAFPAKTTERALDRTVYQVQQVDRRVADAEATSAAISATIAGKLDASTHNAFVASQDTRDDGQDTAITAASSVHYTSSFNVPAIASLTCADWPVGATGAALGAVCAVGLPSTAEPGLILNCFVSAAGIVKLRFCNVSAAPIDPPPGTSYSFRVFNP